MAFYFILFATASNDDISIIVSQLPKVEWLNQWRSESDDFRRSKAKIKGLVVFTFRGLNLIHR